MYSAKTEIRVRYGETDQMSYLYHGNYASYYEVGRTDAMRALGLAYKELEEKGIMMPVVKQTMEYLRPVFYDDLITVTTIIKELPEGSKVDFHTEMYNEKGKLVNRGVTTLVFYNKEQRKTVAMPEIMKQQLQPFFS
ncbi:MAG: thioesterase family protein [Flavipsychrobacter sp.]